MRLRALTMMLLAPVLVVSNVHGMFMFEETRNVPIGRLFTNLQQRLAANTNDFELTYRLARLHSMAYATNLIEVSVTKDKHLPVFDYPGDDSGVPRKVSPSPDLQARRAAFEHLTNAILLFERAIVLL